MLKDAITKMNEKLVENNWIISGAREAGWLAWRPSAKRGELIWIDEDEQEWAEEHMMSSRRVHHEWMARRAELKMDEDGVPMMPAWLKEEDQKKHICLPTSVDQKDNDQIVITVDEESIFTNLHIHPQLKSTTYKQCFEYLTSQTKGINTVLQDQYKCKKQVRFALKKLIKE